MNALLIGTIVVSLICLAGVWFLRDREPATALLFLVFLLAGLIVQICYALLIDKTGPELWVNLAAAVIGIYLSVTE